MFLGSSRQSRQGNEKGIGILEAVIAGAILAIVIAGVFQLFVYMTNLLARLERRAQVNAVVARAGSNVQNASMLELMRACRDESSGAVSQCVDPTERAAANGLADHVSPNVSSLWKRPYGWAGELVPAESMKICVELVRCDEVLLNQLMDVNLKAWWFHNGSYRSQIFVFRRGTL